MGCIQTQNKSKTHQKVQLPIEKHAIYKCYQTNTLYVNEIGQQYQIIREGKKLTKVPILKRLQQNPLYLKRTTSQSDLSIQSKSTL
ncbi:unnamed protein product [Paramecium pentaurelia]|uniref:Uncharacterized protein n=1 Tax=Paramecium pentaurelia TaxID=43138 RepID=A0A8S1VKH8_9CILI|nr:unnamed protein product [Paramecium pentaurelia]